MTQKVRITNYRTGEKTVWFVVATTHSISRGREFQLSPEENGQPHRVCSAIVRPRTAYITSYEKVELIED